MPDSRTSFHLCPGSGAGNAMRTSGGSWYRLAGRLYPIPLDAPAHQDPKELPLSLREALTVKKATPGMGRHGMSAGESGKR
jgi:hypothetical protein